MSSKVESIHRTGVATRAPAHGHPGRWVAAVVALAAAAALAGWAFLEKGSEGGRSEGGAGGEVVSVEAGLQISPRLTGMARAGVAPGLVAAMESRILRAEAYGPPDVSVPDPRSRPQVKGSGGASGGAFGGTMGPRIAPNDAGGLCQAC